MNSEHPIQDPTTQELHKSSNKSCLRKPFGERLARFVKLNRHSFISLLPNSGTLSCSQQFWDFFKYTSQELLALSWFLFPLVHIICNYFQRLVKCMVMWDKIGSIIDLWQDFHVTIVTNQWHRSENWNFGLFPPRFQNVRYSTCQRTVDRCAWRVRNKQEDSSLQFQLWKIFLSVWQVLMRAVLSDRKTWNTFQLVENKNSGIKHAYMKYALKYIWL